MRVRVEGARQLDQIARVLEAQGNSRALKRRMTKAFKKAAEPITRDQVENLAKKLPHRGGAAATISAGTKTSVRTDWGRAVVTISDTWPGHDIKAIERGVLRHPTFGRRSGRWHVTNVPVGILEEPFAAHKPEVVAELAKEMDALAEEITRET